jgi:hypothetical protein
MRGLFCRILLAACLVHAPALAGQVSYDRLANELEAPCSASRSAGGAAFDDAEWDW